MKKEVNVTLNNVTTFEGWFVIIKGEPACGFFVPQEVEGATFEEMEAAAKSDAQHRAAQFGYPLVDTVEVKKLRVIVE